MGHRVIVSNWKDGAFHLLTFYDSSFCITSLECVKSNYLVLGDIHSGVEFLRCYQDPTANSVTRLERLGKSITTVKTGQMVGGKPMEGRP